MKTCQIHNRKFSEKSPNKAGKYWHVINYGEGEFCSITKEEYEALPEDAENEKQPISSSTTQTREAIPQRDYEKEAEGKVRHGFAIEAFKLGKPLDDDTKAEIEAWVTFVMKGI